MMAIRSVLLALLVALTSYRTSVRAWMPAHDITSCKSPFQFRLQQQQYSSTPRCLDVSTTRYRTLSSSSPLRASAIDETTAILQVHEATSPSSSPEPPSEETLELSTEQQIVNLLFLSATFGYAIYTILNIDNGMTRGWTGSEIAMRIPLDNWGAYESYLANKPVFTKTLINVIIYLLGDWLSQTAFQGKNVLNFDLGRTVRNGFIGLCFGPLVHEYYQFSDTILPAENGLVTRLEKILMDQTLYLTIKCSIYISAVGLLSGDDLPTVKKTVTDKIGGIVITAWKFWPLIHCITYGLIPARHRILWVNSVDLVWNAILASQAQKDAPEDEEEGASQLALNAVEVEEIIVPELVRATEDSEKSNHRLVVLDNKWVEDQKEVVAEILSPSSSSSAGSSNTTAEAVLTR